MCDLVPASLCMTQCVTDRRPSTSFIVSDRRKIATKTKQTKKHKNQRKMIKHSM